MVNLTTLVLVLLARVSTSHDQGIDGLDQLKGKRVSIYGQHLTFGEVIDSLNKQANAQYELSKELRENKATIFTKDVPADELLAKFTKTFRLAIERRGQGWRIAMPARDVKEESDLVKTELLAKRRMIEEIVMVSQHYWTAKLLQQDPQIPRPPGDRPKLGTKEFLSYNARAQRLSQASHQLGEIIGLCEPPVGGNDIDSLMNGTGIIASTLKSKYLRNLKQHVTGFGLSTAPVPEGLVSFGTVNFNPWLSDLRFSMGKYVPGERGAREAGGGFTMSLDDTAAEWSHPLIDSLKASVTPLEKIQTFPEFAQKIPPDPEGHFPGGPRSGDPQSAVMDSEAVVLEALHKSTGMPVLTDGFRLSMAFRFGRTPMAQPTGAVLAKLLADSGVMLNVDSGWITARQWAYWRTRSTEPSELLIRKYEERKAKTGSLLLADYRELWRQLTAPQILRAERSSPFAASFDYSNVANTALFRYLDDLGTVGERQASGPEGVYVAFGNGRLRDSTEKLLVDLLRSGQIDNAIEPMILRMASQPDIPVVIHISAIKPTVQYQVIFDHVINSADSMQKLQGIIAENGEPSEGVVESHKESLTLSIDSEGLGPVKLPIIIRQWRAMKRDEWAKK